MINKIENIVCEEFGVTSEDIHSGSRAKNIVAAKNAVWYFLYTVYGLSSSKIAKEYNTTQRNFWYAISKLKFLVKADKDCCAQFSRIGDKIMEKLNASPFPLIK